MIWMSPEWDEWLLNDVIDTDYFPLMGAESRGTQEVVQTILSHSETDDEWLLNDVNDTDCFPLMGAESRGTQEVVQAILSHSETDD